MDAQSLAPGIDAKLLDSKLAELEKARAWSPRLVSKLEALINHPDPWSLYRINPIQFGLSRGVDESEAIDLFLHASRAGLFKMEWHLVCPSCGDLVESFESLTGLHSHFTCQMCQMDTNAQLDDYIEISFSVLPAVRDCPFHHPEALSAEDFCFKYHFNTDAKVPSGPVFRDVLIQVGKACSYLEPGQKSVFEFQMAPGFMLAWDLIKDAGFFFEVSGESSLAPQLLQVSLGNNGYWPAQGKLKPGPVRLEIDNTRAVRSIIMVGQLGPDHFSDKRNLELPLFLSGNRLLNNQTFRNLYRGETILGSEGIGVRDLALLFTDLKGSTAMYERIGDLKAFALVQQHFEHLTKSIASHRGAVVKTIGDAVMASFSSPKDAVLAAVDMLREIEAFNRSQGHREILLKIGVHRGPSIAVTLNEKLDYFGQTVNIAARVQGLADAEEICVTDAVWRVDGVPQALSGLDSSVEDAEIKGISSRMRVYRMSAPAGRGAGRAERSSAPTKAKSKKKAKPAAPRRGRAPLGPARKAKKKARKR